VGLGGAALFRSHGGDDNHAPDVADQPSVEQDPAHQGGMIVTPKGNDDKVTITFTDENNQPHTVVVAKDPNGKWKPEGDLPTGVHVENDGTVTLDPNAVKDNTPVKAIGGKDGADDSTPATGTAGNDAEPAREAPEIVIHDGDEGKDPADRFLNKEEVDNNPTATVTLPKDAKPGDTLHVTFEGEGKEPVDADPIVLTPEMINKGTVEVPVAKDAIPEKGTLTATAEVTNKDGVPGKPAHDKTNVDQVVPGDSNGDGKADGSDENNGAPVISFPEDNSPKDGVLNGKENQSDNNPDKTTIQADLPKGTEKGDTVEIKVTTTNKDGEREEKTISVKVEDPSKPVTTSVDVKEGDKITATATVKDPAGNHSAPSNTAEVTVDGKAPIAPVKPQDNGDVKVDMPTDPDATKVTITFPPEDGGKDKTVTVVKNPDGKWEIENPTDNPDVTIDNNGTITIPAKDVKDGGKVETDAEDKAGNHGKDDGKAEPNKDKDDAGKDPSDDPAQPENHAPDANDDEANGSSDKPAKGNVLTNDKDDDSDPLKVTGVKVDLDGDGTPDDLPLGKETPIFKDGEQIGTIKVDENGDFTITPSKGYTGDLPEVTYTVTDGKDRS
ncbi:hypothetical protein HPC38_10210, partial [Pasteurellaceae bacterium HPA106]|uniref:Ig-like domain-containing protein n=1 Tax=Spirabiliibacterium pneumoniae TaxID=221400 RepID=UPI001F1E5B03